MGIKGDRPEFFPVIEITPTENKDEWSGRFVYNKLKTIKEVIE